MTWIETTDHIYSGVTVPVFAKKVGRGTVYLRDENNFTFTASFGANSDKSFTGCFYGHPEIKTLQDAMNALDNRQF